MMTNTESIVQKFSIISETGSKKQILILENTFLKVEVEQILEKERLGIKCY